VQGRCIDPPTPLPSNYQPGQCLIATPQQLITTAGRGTAVLVTHLYIERTPTPNPGFDDGIGFETLVLAEAGSTLWMANVTLSGCSAADFPGSLSRVSEGAHVQPGGGCGHRGRGLHTVSSRVLLAGVCLPMHADHASRARRPQAHALRATVPCMQTAT